MQPLSPGFRRTIRRLCLCGLLILSAACSGPQDETPLTVSAERREFRTTIAAEGTVKSRRSYTLTVPILRMETPPEIAFLVEEGSLVRQGEEVVRLDASRIKITYDNNERELQVAAAETGQALAQQAAERGKLQGEIASAEAAAAASRLQLARLEFVAARERRIRELEIERSTIQATRARDRLTSLEEVWLEDLKQKRLKANQVRSRLEQAGRNLELLILRAPADGYVMYEFNRMTRDKVKQGDNIYPGQPVVSIPDLSGLQVSLSLDEARRKSVVEGQPVIITVPLLGELQLQGKVTQVGRVPRSDRRDAATRLFEVLVELENPPAEVVPGLTARCEIEVGRIAEAVVVPWDAIFRRDSLDLVYIEQQDGAFTPRTVTLGERGGDFLVVTEGLEGGERLALVEPPQSDQH